MLKKINAKNANLDRERQKKLFLLQMHGDELERLEHLGELRIDPEIHPLEQLPVTDYENHPDAWKLNIPDHSGDPILVKDMAPKHHRQRVLTVEEAKILGERLSKRQEHHHNCICEFCRAHGATHHIKSFPVKPMTLEYH